MPSADAQEPPAFSLRLIGAIAIVLVIGAALRLIWPADMEYKGDEIYTFERTQNVGVSEPWPWTGMNNSADVPHPGMSVWVFVGLAKLVNADDPVTLDVACIAVNVVALGLFAIFIASTVPANEREPWWWGLTLLSVNPLAILFHRKIWPPSLVPAISILLLALWCRRRRPLAAFTFGIVAALAAQIHPGAFFFVSGLSLWVLLFDRRSCRWLWTIAGGLIGSIPAWPWLYHLLFVAQQSAAAKTHWSRLIEFKYWVYWFTEPFGLNLQYSLGQDFDSFLRWPIVNGTPTYFVALLHLILIITGIVVLSRFALTALRNGDWILNRTQTGMLIGAVGIGYGLLLTITGLPVYRHYLIVAAPIACVAAARCCLIGFSLPTARRVLGGLCMAQCAMSALFLMYIHNSDRPIRGDYGAPYQLQAKLRHRLVGTPTAHAGE